jgi:hypothetical protein
VAFVVLICNVKLRILVGKLRYGLSLVPAVSLYKASVGSRYYIFLELLIQHKILVGMFIRTARIVTFCGVCSNLLKVYII